MRWHAAWVAWLFVVSPCNVSSAHEVRPGYLELRELAATAPAGETQWELLFKVPARGELRLGIDVRLPDFCSRSEFVAHATEGAHIERWRVTCQGDLFGREIAIDGLPLTRTDVLARVERADGSTQTSLLTADAPAFTLEREADWTTVARTYFLLGLEHILLGADHLLFVLALLFLVTSWRRLVATVTAFTVAHSLTLAAATLGLVHVPPAPVEACIALSIVFVAYEVLLAAEGQPALAARWPWIVAFAFGLLHGLGFAGALREVGLPENAVPAALLFFNLGVETGQLFFVAAVFAMLGLARRLAPAVATDTWDVARRLARPVAYAIGSMASFWLIERTARFWGA